MTVQLLVITSTATPQYVVSDLREAAANITARWCRGCTKAEGHQGRARDRKARDAWRLGGIREVERNLSLGHVDIVTVQPSQAHSPMRSRPLKEPHPAGSNVSSIILCMMLTMKHMDAWAAEILGGRPQIKPDTCVAISAGARHRPHAVACRVQQQRGWG
jgi:hypothetical protein